MYKLLISLLILTGCGDYNETRFYPIPGPTDTEMPEQTETCTVIQEINQATIICPDGTSAIITNGKDGEDGRRGEQGIKGDAGENGIDGQDGVDGISPEPCTVYELNKNFIRIECPDGTFQDIRKK